MPVPDYQTLMLPLLEQAARGETRVPDVADKLEDQFALLLLITGNLRTFSSSMRSEALRRSFLV